MSNIVGIGANVYDTLLTFKNFPEEDKKTMCDSIAQSGGGPCATALVTASKLGAKCAYIGALSDDAGGVFLRNDMKKYGVSDEYTGECKGSSAFSSYIILNMENTTRTCLLNKKNLPEWEIDEKSEKAIEKADILLVDGNELENAVKGALTAKKSGTKVLYDAGGLYNGVQNLLELTDILIPSEEFALAFTGEKSAETAARKLFELFLPEVVIITQGKKGGILFDGKEIKAYPAFKVDAVDSNGAGDVFHGAFAFALSAKLGYYEACVFSSAVSALKCTKTGARIGSPDYKETINFLKERGYNEFKENMD